MLSSLHCVFPKEVRFTLDRCSGAAVMEMEGLGTWLTTEDHSSCEVTGVTPNTDRYINTRMLPGKGAVLSTVHSHFKEQTCLGRNMNECLEQYFSNNGAFSH